MKTARGSKILALMVGLSLVLGFTVSKAYCWAAGTHAYIGDQLQRKRGLKNLGEIYGGMAPDIPNFLFAAEYRQDFYDITHDEFMDVWGATSPGKSNLHKAYAYGFATHHYADITAHSDGITYGQDKGYVIAKATELKTDYLIPGLTSLGLSFPDYVAQEISHNIVEYAVDLLMKGKDGQIGKKMSAAALIRNPRFPVMLARAFGEELVLLLGISPGEAAAIITGGEQTFRKIVILEGQALMQNDNAALELLSQQLAELTVGFLAAFHIELPDLVLAQLPSIVKNYLTIAMGLCSLDFENEINATIAFVDQKLDEQGISYGNGVGGKKETRQVNIPNRWR